MRRYSILMAASATLCALFCIYIASLYTALYGEGAPMKDFQDGAHLSVFSNNLSSDFNHEFYDYDAVKMCPTGNARKMTKPQVPFFLLGRQFQGEYSRLTGYGFKMGVDEFCKQACSLSYTPQEQNEFTKLIWDYKVHLVLDNMPVASGCRDDFCLRVGVPIGYTEAYNSICLYNHLRFTVEYHIPKPLYKPNGKENRKNIIGFKVRPFSVDHKAMAAKGTKFTCPVLETPIPETWSPMCFKKNKVQSVVWTYDVEYKLSHVKWANRWETLLYSLSDMKYRQASDLFMSLYLIFLFTAMLGSTLRKHLRQDDARTNNNNITDDALAIEHATGWKALRGDVFRPPRRGGLLSILVACGFQILCMFAIMLVLALWGIGTDSAAAILFLWFLASTYCAYWSARLYCTLEGSNKYLFSLASVFFVPGALLSLFLSLNIRLGISGSADATPRTELLVMLSLWFGISLPLSLYGSHLGYQRGAYKYPVRTRRIPREIPAAAGRYAVWLWLVAGFLVFSVVSGEQRIILSYFHEDKLFYFFGFLPIFFLVVVVSSAGVSIALTQQQLYEESYQWWWPSFLAPASSGVYVFVHGIAYPFMRYSYDSTTITVVDIGYCAICSLAFALATGCIGFLASFIFVRKIYRTQDRDGTRRNLVGHHSANRLERRRRVRTPPVISSDMGQPEVAPQ